MKLKEKLERLGSDALPRVAGGERLELGGLLDRDADGLRVHSAFARPAERSPVTHSGSRAEESTWFWRGQQAAPRKPPEAAGRPRPIRSASGTLAPWIDGLLPGTAQQAMYAVGVVEIVAGIAVALVPRLGAWVVAAWLLGIIVNLVTIPGFYDVALRDFGLLVAAVALARLSARYAPGRAVRH